MRNTQTYLIMSHDNDEGRMFLEKDRLRIDWPGVGGQPVFERINQQLLNATKPLGGTFVPNPSWSKLTNQNLTSVHPLGGCVMAEVRGSGRGESQRSGLQRHDGKRRLRRPDRFRRFDLPMPMGINPLLTISAIAERNCALLAEDRGWTIDYKLGAPPVRRLRRLKPGVQFTETMKGSSRPR